jgi:hypothetical protein
MMNMLLHPNVLWPIEHVKEEEVIKYMAQSHIVLASNQPQE